MAFTYHKGQVVDVYWTNDDPNNPGIKLRPCLIIEVISATYFKFASITGTDRSGFCKGIIIEPNTADYKSMRLTKRSFINLSDVKILPVDLIRAYRGSCNRMVEINALLKSE